MFILNLTEEAREGAFCVLDKYGDKVIYFFEEYDDAERYAGLLEADDYPELHVVEVANDIATKTCEMYNYNYVIIGKDDVVIPPKQDAAHKKT